MQNELTELLHMVSHFNQDRITGTELYVLMKILTKPEKYIWNHYFLALDSKQHMTVILKKGETDEMSHAFDSVFYLEARDRLQHNKRDHKYGLAEPRRQILGLRATEVAEIPGI